MSAPRGKVNNGVDTCHFFEKNIRHTKEPEMDPKRDDVKINDDTGVQQPNLNRNKT